MSERDVFLGGTRVLEYPPLYLSLSHSWWHTVKRQDLPATKSEIKRKIVREVGTGGCVLQELSRLLSRKRESSRTLTAHSSCVFT